MSPVIQCTGAAAKPNRSFATLIAARDEIIEQGRLAATNVDDGAIAIRRGDFDEPQRSLQVRAIPAYLVLRLGLVDVFPMGLGSHRRHSGAVPENWG